MRTGTLFALLLVLCGCNGGDEEDRNVVVSDTIQAERLPITLLRFDKDGKVQNDEVLAPLLEDATTTDLFIMSHGWNTSIESAANTYREMTDLMGDIADEEDVRPEGFNAKVIGIRWPSLAWEDGLTEESAVGISVTLPDNVDEVLENAAPGISDEELGRVTEFLGQTAATDAEYLEILTTLEKYVDGPSELDKADPVASTELTPEGTVPNVSALFRNGPKNVGRVFTFWQMKRRAGVVGETGFRPILNRIQVALPNVRIHLLGHSFGSRLLLAACRNPDGNPSLTRPVDTIVLVQPAISHASFSKAAPGADANTPGGFRSAIVDGPACRGPIVATYTDRDVPLANLYPLAARLGGQTGDTESPVSKYSAMGGVGIFMNDVESVDLREFAHGAPPRYAFTPGKIYQVSGAGLIRGHSDHIGNRHLAWLIWSAVVAQN